RVIGVHVLRNILIPIVTVIGLEFGSVIAFAIVTETVFAWPGMGKLLIDSINLLDRPIIVAYLLVIVFMFIVINLLVDILYSALGLELGLAAAYLGGRTETVIMRIADIQLSFPAILIALILLAVLGQGMLKIIAALVTVQWAYYARTVRSAALVEKRKEYIEAARCLALPPSRIVFRHRLPNCLPPLIVVATVQVAAAIALEATLSFLGLGLPITEPSLGLLIANGYQYLLSGKYWISFFPGVALLLTIVSINLVADQLRDVLNPRFQR